MFINIKNIKLEGKDELCEAQTKVNTGAPFTEFVLNNPEQYPIADEYRARILQELEAHYGARIESCDMEFTEVHPRFAQLVQSWKEMQSAEGVQTDDEMSMDLKLFKALFQKEPYEKLPDAFKNLPFTTDMYSDAITRDTVQCAYKHLLRLTMDLLTYCTIDFAELSDEEYYRHTDGCVRPGLISGMCDTMFEPYLQWKNLPKEASTFKFVQDNLGELAAEVLQHPSNHYRVAQLLLVVLYMRALAEPQSRFLDTYWSDDEAQAHNYLYYFSSIHELEQHVSCRLMSGIFAHLNTTTESTMPKIHELQELYEAAHRTAMALNIKAHKRAVQTGANIAEAMRNAHLTTETTHVFAHVIEQDDEAKCRIVEVRYQNTDTIAESCKNEIKDASYVYTTHTQEWNAETEKWETTVTQPFALANGDASTLFSGEYGRCMILSDERLEMVLQYTVASDDASPDATEEFEKYTGTYIWPFPKAFKRLVTYVGRNTLLLLKEHGNSLFYLDGEDEDLTKEYL